MRKARWSHRTTAWFFILPALAVYALFVVLPIADSFRLSLHHWDSAAATPRFVGMANFAALAHDPVFWSALWHNVLLLALSLVIQLPIALGLAVLLSYPIRGRWLFRTVFFAPMVMPSVAIAVLWSYIYLPEQGLLDQTIRIFDKGWGGDWLGSPTTAMLCVFVTICWRYVGFYMVLFMAGIAAIPEELYEAARIDGASEWQAFREITLPMLRPTLAVAAVLCITGSLKYFDLVYMMAGGAPETSRELLATYVYRLAFDSGQGRFGYGSAVATALFLIALAAAILILRARRAEKGAVAP
jgi:raffinose/stachyose/melibiose transport system permease protein